MSSFRDRVFRPLKARACNRVPVFAFDVETYFTEKTHVMATGEERKYTEQNFLCGALVGKGYSRVSWDLDEFKKMLLSRRTRGSIIAATNISFDFGQTFHGDYKDFKLIFRNGLKCVIKNDKKTDGEKDSRKKNNKWRFTDTLNYAQMGVKALGDLFNLPKLPHPACFTRKPKDIFEKQEMEAYVLRDAEISYVFMENFVDTCDMLNQKLGLTIGSCGIDFQRRNYQKDNWIREPDWMLEKHFLGSMRGGITSVFKRGTYDCRDPDSEFKRLYYFDYRSHYPARAYYGIDGKGSMPDVNTYKYMAEGTANNIDEYEGISHVVMVAPWQYFPFLSVKYDGKLMNPYGKIEGWFNNFEIRKAMDKFNYQLLSVKEQIYYENTFVPFREPVGDLYKLRKRLQKEKDPREKIIKFEMNSAIFGRYGFNYLRMGECVPLQSITYDKDGRAYYMDDEKAIYLDRYEIEELKDAFDGFLVYDKIGKPMKYSFPILSETVSGLGRVKLVEDNFDADPEGKHLIYTDTDSSIVSKKIFEEGDELGDWELEHTLWGFRGIKPKHYMIYIDDEKNNRTIAMTKAKGIGKALQYEADWIHSCYSGHVDLDRFSGLKESNRMNIRPGSIIDIRKHISMEDTKRDWMGKRFKLDGWQDSRPLRL